MGWKWKRLSIIKYRRPSLLLSQLMPFEDVSMDSLSAPSCTVRSVFISDKNDDDILRLSLQNLLMISLCSATGITISSEGLLGHDVVEVFPWDLAPVGCSTLQHLLQFLYIHCLSKFLCHATNVGGVDAASMVVVKQVEDFVDSVLNEIWVTLLSLSPSLEVIPSRNSSKSTSRPSDSN